MCQLVPFLLRNVKGRLRLIQRSLLRKSDCSTRPDVRSEFLQVMHHTQCRSSGTIRRGPADVVFDRGSLCYARPAYIPHTGVIVAGLPPKRSYTYMRENILSYNHADILNVLNLSFHRSTIAPFQTRDYHRRMEDARHLSKYVFPREYGLVTVFAYTIKAHKYSDFADREDEIKVRSNALYATCPT